MGLNSPLLPLGLSSGTTQGGFKTPLPFWSAGASGIVQGGFRTPLTFFNSGGGIVIQSPTRDWITTFRRRRMCR